MATAADKSAPATDLAKLVRFYEDAEEITATSRKLSEKCRDYYDHKQWTDAERAALEKRGQPIITNNRIKKKVDFLLGLERQTRADPKAFPRTPQHDQDAEAVTDALRFVAERCDFQALRSAVFENLLIEGTGGGEVCVKPVTKGGKTEFEIELKRCPWDRIFYDSHSREPNYTDAKYKGYVLWMDVEDAIGQWPNAKEVIENAKHANDQYDETYEDVPRWYDKRRDRVKILQIYWREFKDGKDCWYWAIFTQSGYISGPEQSPYLDEDGNPECGIELVSAHIDRDNHRYGHVRQLLDVQDEINKRRSKALHLISQRQTFGRKGAVIDVAAHKREMAKPDGHLEFTNGEFGRDFGIIPTSDMAAANFQLLEESKQEIDAVSVNASMTGQEDRAMSGRALQARQQGGMTELALLFDRLRQWELRMYRQIWNRIRQFWTEEKWIRVTDDEKNVRFVGLNRPVTMAEELQNQGEQLPPQMMSDPRLQQVVRVENPIAELDVDIIIEDAPDTINIQAEQFELLAQLAQAYPQAIPPHLIIKMSSIRNKDQILEEMQAMQQQAAQAQQAQMEMEAQDKQTEQMVKVGKLEADSMKAEASATKDMAQAQKTLAELAMPTLIQ